MLLNPSSVSGTLEQAVESLAVLAAHCRTAPLTYVEKQAIAASDMLGAVGRYASTPGGAAAIGGGVGALAGGVGAAFGNRGKPEGQKRSILGTALTGGLAGAAIGGGAGAAAKGYQGLKTEGPVTGGDIEVPGTGMKLDPKALRTMPGLQKRLQELGTPSIPEMITLPFSEGLAGIDKYMPYTWKAGLGVGAMDYLTHTQNRFGGENMMGDKNWLHAPGNAAIGLGNVLSKAPAVGKVSGAVRHAGGALGRLGVKLRKADYGIGMIDPKNSTSPQDLEAGIKSIVNSGEKEHPQFDSKRRKIMEWLLDTPEGQRKLKEMAANRKGGSVTRDVTTTQEVQPPPVTQTKSSKKFNEKLQDYETWQESTSNVNPPKETKTVTEPATLKGESIRYAKGHGAELQLGKPGLKENVAGHTGTPKMTRGPLGGTSHVPASSVGRKLGRVGAYGLPMAAEVLYNSYHESQARALERAQLEHQLRASGLLR